MVNVRHQGEQYHHNHPSPLTDQLYLAAARAISSRVLLDLGITCIINATLELPTMAYQKQDCLQIAVEDHVASKLYVYFDLVADKIHSVHESDGGKAMIYCRAGMSRSASLCIAYFIKHHHMSLEDAFAYVKQRRPIIQPNVGFMRQLRDYEHKLRGTSTNGRGGSSTLSAKARKLPALAFAHECCGGCTENGNSEDDLKYDDYYSAGIIKIIKPRPTPKQPKVILSEMMDLAAETYTISVVEICDNNVQQPIEAATAAAVQALPQPPMTVAETRMRPTQLELVEQRDRGGEEVQGDPAHTRTAFTKISEPARIAVSCLCLRLESCEEKIGEQIWENSHFGALFSVFTELRALAQVAETLTLECLHLDVHEEPLMKLPRQRARLLLTANALSLPVCSSPPLVLSVDGAFFQRQLLPPNAVRNKSALLSPPPRSLPAPPKKPRLQQQQQQQQRPHRLSVKLPGLKISTLPEKSRGNFILETSSLLLACKVTDPPVTLEEAPERIRPFLVKYRSVAPSLMAGTPLCCATTLSDPADVFEIAVRNPHINYKPGRLLTVARKTVRTATAVGACFPLVLVSNDVLPITALMPSKKFPYYSPVRAREEASAGLLVWASHAPTVEVCYHLALAPRKSTKAVRLLPNKKVRQPQILKLNWAPERFDETSSVPQMCRPMQQVEIAIPRSVVLVSEATVTSDLLVGEALTSLPRFEVQRYPVQLIANMCVYPLLLVAETTSSPVHLESVCELMSCQEFCIDADSSFHMCSESLAVAMVSLVDVRNDLSDLVDIPDAVGDLRDLKARLLELNDPVKASIWLDVFKRTIIRARPIYPFVSVQELLLTAESSEIDDFDEASEVEACDEAWGKELLCQCLTLNEASERVDFLHVEDSQEYFEDCLIYENAKRNIDISLVLETCVITTTVLLENPPPISSSTFSDLIHHTKLNIHGNLSVADSLNYEYCFAETTCNIDLSDQESCLPRLHSSSCLVVARAEYVGTFSFTTHLRYTFDKGLCNADVTRDYGREQTECLIQPAPDVLWFFEISADEKASTPEPGGSFQLFLPDPELAERLLPPIIAEEDEEGEEVNPLAFLPIPELKKPRDFLQISESSSRRVPLEGSDRQSRQYQSVKRDQNSHHAEAARNRSLSRNRPSSREDRRTAAALNASVRQASSLLGRRSRSRVSSKEDQLKSLAREERRKTRTRSPSWSQDQLIAGSIVGGILNRAKQQWTTVPKSQQQQQQQQHPRTLTAAMGWRSKYHS